MTTNSKKVVVKKVNTKQAQASAQAQARTSARKTPKSVKNEVFAKLSTFKNKHDEDRPCVITPYLDKDSFSELATYARANKGTYMKADVHGGSWHFSKQEDANNFLTYANTQFAKGKLVVAEKPEKKAAPKKTARKARKAVDIEAIVAKAVAAALASMR